jgi:hypothetical protein
MFDDEPGPVAAPRTAFDGTQFLLEPPGPGRRQIDNEEGEAVLLVVSPRRRVSLLPRRLAAFYDVATGERLMELRPEPGGRAAHRLVDAEGAVLARFQLSLLAGRWTARDAQDRVLATAAVWPRRAAVAALGRGRWSRSVVMSVSGFTAGVLARRSPEFDGHHLLDLSPDTDGRLDRRIALALAILAG